MQLLILLLMQFTYPDAYENENEVTYFVADAVVYAITLHISCLCGCLCLERVC